MILSQSCHFATVWHQRPPNLSKHCTSFELIFYARKNLKIQETRNNLQNINVIVWQLQN